jgi:hypothetical protein
MNHAFRLSRLRAPRGTLAASLLLAAVFVLFGLVTSAVAHGAAPEPGHAAGAIERAYAPIRNNAFP